MLPIEQVKKNLGDAAAKLVREGMIVGLGTGTTVHYFIQSLIERCQKGLKIQVIPSSEESLYKAKMGNLPILDSDKTIHIDMTVDGADEIDGAKQMIKGGGGALIREKIIASMSREMVVIVDETKVVAKLGKRKLPVEILPFASCSTLHKIHKLGYQGSIRLQSNGKPVITDNGNFLVDIDLDPSTLDPKQTHENLIHIPGVIDTGFFFHLAGRVIIGFFDGQIVIRA